MKALRLVYLGLILILFTPLACNDDPEGDEIEVDIPDEAVMVVMPPAGEFEVKTDKAVITRHDTAPMVHSWPRYAGVPAKGDAGLGSAMGFGAGGRVTIPFNINLGAKELAEYDIRLTVEKPGVLKIVTIEGSNPNLYIYYADQYDRAKGFEISPSEVIWGDTAGVVNISMRPVLEPATGKINLFNLLVDLKKRTPAAGTWILIEQITLKDPDGNDACPAAGCTIYDCLFIKKFVVN